MRTTPRADIGASTAELVFGAPLIVPGDLITSKEFEPASGNLLQRIRQITAGRVPIPTSAHAKPPTHTPKDLETCEHVFVRVDKVVTPLASKYTGPYKVLERSERAYRLDYGTDSFGNELQDWVTIERLKPAYIDDNTFGAETGPTAPMRRGRGRPRTTPAPATATARLPGLKNKAKK